MVELTLFANEQCPFCRMVIDALSLSGVAYEYVEVPMSRALRGEAKYHGGREELKDKSFEELFGVDASIPKAVTMQMEKFRDSQQILAWLSVREAV